MTMKNKNKKLLSKITASNLALLDSDQLNSEYHLQKLYDWQTDYSDYITWEDFEFFTYCERCGSYNEGQCICYARS